MITFQAGQLLDSLETFRSSQFTGSLYLETVDSPGSTVRTMVLALWSGMLTFVGKQLPNPESFTDLVRQKLNVAHIESALKVSSQRVKNKDSIRELFELIARCGLFKWEDLEAALRHDSVLLLEQVLHCSGTLIPKREYTFDLSYGSDRHGFNWEQLQRDLTQRQQLWNALTPIVPSMDAIPIQTQNKLIPSEVHDHIDQWVNNQRSLIEIAQHIGQDPLELAKHYSAWVNQGWIAFKPLTSLDPKAKTLKTSPPPNSLPIVLSVDDSPIVQTMIKRAIGDRYQVLLANSAIEALNKLNAHPVALLLLDVTMPDIDGLELCRTIRQISKFRNLPIVMLTAKDGLLDKAKSQFAGSTHYLHKPVDREKLLPVLEKYILVESPV